MAMSRQSRDEPNEVSADDGSVAKRSNAADCKSVGSAFAGSNPARPTSGKNKTPKGDFIFSTLIATG